MHVKHTGWKCDSAVKLVLALLCDEWDQSCALLFMLDSRIDGCACILCLELIRWSCWMVCRDICVQTLRMRKLNAGLLSFSSPAVAHMSVFVRNDAGCRLCRDYVCVCVLKITGCERDQESPVTDQHWLLYVQLLNTIINMWLHGDKVKHIHDCISAGLKWIYVVLADYG